MERTHNGAVCEALHSIVGTPHCSRDEEGAEGTNCYELTSILRFNPFCVISQGREEAEELGMKMSLGRRWICEREGFRFCICFSPFYSSFNWQRIKLILLKWVSFDCDSNWWVISFLSVCWPLSFSTLFSLPSLLRNGKWQWLGGHLAASQGQPTIKVNSAQIYCVITEAVKHKK